MTAAILLAINRSNPGKDTRATMPTTTEAAVRSTPPANRVSTRPASDQLVAKIRIWLDDAKAEQVVVIDIADKSSIGDYMVVASGRSDRHVGAIADQVHKNLKELGRRGLRVEGQPQCDWVLIDAGAVIVHVFRPEVREFYKIEKMWQAERPDESTANRAAIDQG